MDMRSIGRAGAVAFGLVLLASCARTAPSTAPRGGPDVHERWTSCTTEVPTPSADGGVDAIAMPRLGSGFAPVSVVVCAQGPRQRPDGGTDLVATEGRADAIAALLAALRLPDEPHTNGPCTDDLPTVPWFALLDAQERWIRPGLPVDSCGKIRVEVRRAVDGLKLTEVSSRTIHAALSQGDAPLIALLDR
jgi:hypothetical protein